MARPIVLANGEMHVGLNRFAEVHDFYFPYIGLENHAAASGLRHRIGVWVNGTFSWLDSEAWEFRYKYHDRALVSEIVADNKTLQVRLEFTDCVDAEQAAFVRNVHIINMSNEERDIRLFMHQVFVIGNSRMSDTVQFLPEDRAVMHYKGRRVFIVSGEHDDGEPFEEFSAGMAGIEGREGTYRDAEDGRLEGNVVEHGRVDSVVGFYRTVKPLSSHRVFYWVAAGRSPHEALIVHNRLKENSALHSLTQTAAYWRKWLAPTEHVVKSLPEQYGKSFQQALMIIKSHLDKRGAVMASLDTTMLNYAKDSYSYCWPRDAGYALWPLLRLGYTDELMAFFGFAKRALQDDGYLYHKYQADGALGSSWHPWVHPHGKLGPPIQTDETAIVLFMAGQYHRLHNERQFLVGYYLSLIEPMANFLAYHTDQDGLPLPSYDLWEQKYLTTTYTTAVTYAALLEAADLADEYGRSDDGARWRAAADAMKSASHAFYSTETKCFVKGFIEGENGERVVDATIDVSSVFGAFMYGLFEMDSEEVTSSIASVREKLANSKESTAIIRYEHDDYYRDGDASVESNPWPVASLWMAQIALEQNDVDAACRAVDWVLSLTTTIPTISEQVRPQTFEPASVAPLVWSHAELASTMLDLAQTKGE